MQFTTSTFVALALAAMTAAQKVGTLTAEVHPSLSWKKCTTAGGCVSQAAHIVLDANWRWLHSTSAATNCYDGNTWDTTLCPDPITCAQNCAVDGADYAGTYGITTSGDALTHKFVQQGQYSTNIGSRVYLTDNTDNKYEMFYLLNKEFTFDVDVSKLGCGLNGALYFVEMDADGGLAKHPNNKAGAKYGTGYCDAQCPHDIKFINGEANTIGWNPSAEDDNAGAGKFGTCCPEMDIWEANSISNAYTPHACTKAGQYRCEGLECGDGSDRYKGVCDKDGCDINPYRMGNKSFYGPNSSFTLDTTKKVSVVTQFITNTGTATGTLTEIRRKWVQNGVVYNNVVVNIPGIPAVNSITDSYCAVQKSVFNDPNDHALKGGLAAMGASLARGHVLVMSIWADYAVEMKWLDATWPEDVPATNLGVKRGTCANTGSEPDTIIANAPNSSVTFSNIRFGDIDSTYSGTPGTGTGTTTSSTVGPTTTATTSTKTTTTTTTTAAGTTTTAPAPGSIGKWQQCGGINWSGSGSCVSGSTCQVINPYYYQCL